jgi:hypothetical protein
VARSPSKRRTGVPPVYSEKPERLINSGSASPLDGIVMEPTALAPVRHSFSDGGSPLNCVPVRRSLGESGYRDDPHGIPVRRSFSEGGFLYQGDCLEAESDETRR